jgi:DNA-binding CsgD family transcriptional regulator
MGREHSEGEIVLSGLTAKQREVLDLLIEHKTSKEIARRLGISPHTVDQRIQFAKEKLGAASRNEAAALYRRLLEICGQMTYEDSYVANALAAFDNTGGTQGPFPESSRRERAHSFAGPGNHQVVPELFEGRYGTLIRLGAIISIAVFLVILVLGGLAIFSQLSELMSA